MRRRSGSVQNLVLAAMLAALTCLCTMLFEIPVVGAGGYIHLGDSMVLLGAWYLGGVYGAAAAAIGSVLADLLLGAAVYVPATFVLKAAMAAAAWQIHQKLPEHRGQWAGAALATLLMTAGYFLYECFVLGYGFGALAAVPFSLLQGFCGAGIAMFFSRLMARNTALRTMLRMRKPK